MRSMPPVLCAIAIAITSTVAKISAASSAWTSIEPPAVTVLTSSEVGIAGVVGRRAARARADVLVDVPGADLDAIAGLEQRGRRGRGVRRVEHDLGVRPAVDHVARDADADGEARRAGEDDHRRLGLVRDLGVDDRLVQRRHVRRRRRRPRASCGPAPSPRPAPGCRTRSRSAGRRAIVSIRLKRKFCDFQPIELKASVTPAPSPALSIELSACASISRDVLGVHDDVAGRRPPASRRSRRARSRGSRSSRSRSRARARVPPLFSELPPDETPLTSAVERMNASSRASTRRLAAVTERVADRAPRTSLRTSL